MQISYNILKEFIKIPKSISPAEIALKLTTHTAEVENFFDQKDQFLGVVVGKVLSVEKHPQADRLNLAKVDIKKEILDIVCGALNLEEGQLVPVATIGTILHGGIEIKESEIRGEKSSGMICAEDELGLGADHEGIMILDKKAKIGESFASYLKTNDIIFEIDNKSLSNRPDLFSHYGIARELSAIFSLDLKAYQDFVVELEKIEAEDKLEVEVEKKEVCPRYMAVKVEGIKIKESPEWLKNKLIAIGQKPVNNVIDLGNYVMFEMGQPLHIFDAEKIKKINVRLAKKNEVIETLDEKERTLLEDDIVISDGSLPIAIAGIMGGKDSAVSDKTSSIIIESANFKDTYIRRTSQRLGIRTEASIRYEKSLDTELPEIGLKRFLKLLKEILPDIKVVSNIADIKGQQTEKKEINFSYLWLENKIGQTIERKEAFEYLNKLGFEVNEDEDKIKVVVPVWRATKDINIKEDILEEVLRLHGYDNIKSSLPREELSAPTKNEERELERKIKNFFALKYSLFEVYNYSFVNSDQLNKLEIDFTNYLKLAQPLSDNQTYLRQSLITNLILNIKTNQAKADRLGFFELGKVFYNNPGNIKKDPSKTEVLPHQESKLAFIISDNSNDLFLQAKGMAQSLFNYISNGKVELEFLLTENLANWSDKNEKVIISFLGEKIGIISTLKKEIAEKMGIKKKVVFGEINMNDVLKISQNFSIPVFTEVPRYPAVIRDLAFVVDEEIMYNDIRKEIVNFSPLINSLELFDVYQGDNLEKGKKSLAFHISYLSLDKTLTAKEVDELQKNLIVVLSEKFAAALRDF